MTAMSESLERLHDVDKHDDKEKESAWIRPRHSPKPGIFSVVNERLTKGQAAQDINSDATERLMILLNHSTRLKEPQNRLGKAF